MDRQDANNMINTLNNMIKVLDIIDIQNNTVNNGTHLSEAHIEMLLKIIKY